MAVAVPDASSEEASAYLSEGHRTSYEDKDPSPIDDQVATRSKTTLGKRRKAEGQRSHSSPKRAKISTSPSHDAEVNVASEEAGSEAHVSRSGVSTDVNDVELADRERGDDVAQRLVDDLLDLEANASEEEQISALVDGMRTELCTTIKTFLRDKTSRERQLLQSHSEKHWSSLLLDLHGQFDQSLQEVSDTAREAEQEVPALDVASEESSILSSPTSPENPIRNEDLERPAAPGKDGTFDEDSFFERARRAAEAALNGQAEQSDDDRAADIALPTSGGTKSTQPKPGTTTNRRPPSPTLAGSNQIQRSPPDSIPGSTRELYEQARVAAADRVIQKRLAATVAAANSARRTWSTAEEDALMHGLDRVQGPHWSKILAMYGADGIYGDVLKDRSQVQLKDKARNLKMYFLKTGQAVPACLSHVTGDLRKRAPQLAEVNVGGGSINHVGEVETTKKSPLAPAAVAELDNIKRAREAEDLMSSPGPESTIGPPQAAMNGGGIAA